MSIEAVRGTVQHVRALLQRLEAPLVSLESITHGAQTHIDALTPEFSAFSAAPFESVAVFDTERHPALVEEPPRARRILEPSAVAPRSTRAPGATAASNTTTPGSQPARGAPIPVHGETSAAGDSIRESVRENNADKAYTLQRLNEANRIADFTSAQQAAIADVSSDLAEQERDSGDRQPANFGALASAVLRRRRTSEQQARAAKSTSSALPIPAAPSRTEAGFARGARLRPARNSARKSPPPSVARAAEQQPESDRIAAPPRAIDSAELPIPEPIPRTSRTPFYFNPLEERPPADDADDVLADRIGQVLREQARRQGVDLT